MTEKKPAEYAINLILAMTAGLSGCITLILVMGFLLGGLWLDSLFNTRPLFTIILILIGIPVALRITLWVALRSAKTLERRQYGETDEI